MLERERERERERELPLEHQDDMHLPCYRRVILPAILSLARLSWIHGPPVPSQRREGRKGEEGDG